MKISKINTIEIVSGKINKNYTTVFKNSGRLEQTNKMPAISSTDCMESSEETSINIREYLNKKILRKGENHTSNDDFIEKELLINKESKNIQEFKTLYEAKKYYIDEYGIDAQFKNLNQAYVFKKSIDDFAALNYKGKGKKLFEGLKIELASDIDNCNTYLRTAYRVFLPFGYSYDRETDDLEKISEADVCISNKRLQINSSINWTLWQQKDRYLSDKDKSFHPGTGISPAINHELGHWLHMQNSPKLFLILSKRALTSEERNCASKISGYAMQNGDEYIAEYIAGRMAGIEYPKEVTELYKKFGGPDLFNDR